MLVELEQFVLDSLQTIFDRFGWLGVMAVMVFENATGITPSEVVLGLAGWFLLERHGAPVSWVFIGGLYAAIGSTLGALLPYTLARVGGRPAVEKALRWFRISPAVLDQTDRQFRRYGPWIVFFGRMIPGVRTLVNIPAGLARLPVLRFVGTTFVGVYIWNTLFIGLGYVVGYEWPILAGIIKEYFPLVIAVGALSLLIAGIWRWRTRQVRTAEIPAVD